MLGLCFARSHAEETTTINQSRPATAVPFFKQHYVRVTILYLFPRYAILRTHSQSLKPNRTNQPPLHASLRTRTTTTTTCYRTTLLPKGTTKINHIRLVLFSKLRLYYVRVIYNIRYATLRNHSQSLKPNRTNQPPLHASLRARMTMTTTCYRTTLLPNGTTTINHILLVLFSKLRLYYVRVIIDVTHSQPKPNRTSHHYTLHYDRA